MYLLVGMGLILWKEINQSLDLEIENLEGKLLNLLTSSGNVEIGNVTFNKR